MGNSSATKNRVTDYLNLKSSFPDIPNTRYLTHGLDRYPAKMIPQMSRFIVLKVSDIGDTILDPFCGSGSILIESMILGRNAIGVDINPLASLYAMAKSYKYDADQLNEQLEEIVARVSESENSYEYSFPNQDYWFPDVALKELGVIRAVLDSFSRQVSHSYSSFWYAILASIVRSCSRAVFRSTKPYISKKARFIKRGNHLDPYEQLFKTSRFMISRHREYSLKRARSNKSSKCNVFVGDARHLSSFIKPGSANVIITSPPYMSAQDYYRSSKLELYVIGTKDHAELINWSRCIIGTERIVRKNLSLPEMSILLGKEYLSELQSIDEKNAIIFHKYVADMTQFFKEAYLILKKNAYIAIVMGSNTISGVRIPTSSIIIEIAESEGFDLEDIYVDRIRDRMVPPKRNGHYGVIPEEYILLFHRK